MRLRVIWESYYECENDHQAAELAAMQARENVLRDGFVFRVGKHQRLIETLPPRISTHADKLAEENERLRREIEVANRCRAQY